MREQFPPVTINFSSLRVVGWPGLVLVLIVIAIALEFPQTRALLLLGAAAGTAVGAALVYVRSRHG
jgi:hypothetical protein